MTELGWAALVPMRHGSERVPGKNHRLLAGRPLFHYILDSLRQIDRIELIVVDTDSQPVKESLANSFPEVRILDRPAELRAGDVPMNDVIAHDVQQVVARHYLQTHSTNPLLQPETIMAALLEYEKDPTESLFGVTRLQTRLWNELGRPLNHDPGRLLRTQDLEPVFEENSCLYMFSRGSFLENGNRLSAHPRMFEIPPSEAWDIDDESDFTVVDCLIRIRTSRSETRTPSRRSGE